MTRSKFLITRERAKPRFRAKIGDFRANPAREPTGTGAGLTQKGSAFVLLWVCEESRFPPSPPPLHPPLFLFPPLSLSLSSLLSLFVLSFRFLAGRCQSCGVRSPSCSVPVASCARCQSRFAQSPRRVESRVIASSVAGGFPQLFPLGTGLDKHKTGLSPPLLKHLLAHFTTVLANNAHFLF